MKQFYYSLFSFVFCNFLNAQNPELFDKWYLHEIQIEIQPTIYVEEYEPAISPTLILHENLTYEGALACNSFSGIFNLEDDDLFFMDYTSTMLECETQELNDFETYYSYLFFGDEHLPLWLWQNPETEQLEMWFGSSSGVSYRFLKHPVVMETQNVSEKSFKIYPNPVSNYLVIENSKDNSNYQIFTMDSKLISNGKLNSTKRIDISELEKGNYMLKIGKWTQKFIKK